MPTETAEETQQVPAPSPEGEQATAVQPRVAAKPDAAGKGKGKGAKEDKKGNKKGKKGEADDGAAGDAPSVAAHPRAARAVARAKGWGGLLGFLIAGYTALSTNTFADAMLHALVAGVVCYVVVWAGAVFMWRRLVMLEVRNREAQIHAQNASPKRELPPGPPTAGRRAR
jgi:hypothetical protein